MRIALGALALATGMLPVAARAADDELQQWSNVAISGEVAPRVIAGLELTARFVDDVDRVGVTIIRPTIAYRASDAVTVALGYARQVQRNENAPDLRENRVFQQLVWTPAKIGSVALSTRFRLEQRFVENADETGWRARALVRVQRPVTERVVIYAQGEGFAALNTTDWGARSGFDQSRVGLGFNLRIARAVTIETGYLNRYQRRRGTDRMDHVIPLTLSVTL